MRNTTIPFKTLLLIFIICSLCFSFVKAQDINLVKGLPAGKIDKINLGKNINSGYSLGGGFSNNLQQEDIHEYDAELSPKWFGSKNYQGDDATPEGLYFMRIRGEKTYQLSKIIKR